MRLTLLLPLLRRDSDIDVLVEPAIYGTRRIDLELVGLLLDRVPSSKGRVVDYNANVAYVADELFVASPTPCESPPTKLLRAYRRRLFAALGLHFVPVTPRRPSAASVLSPLPPLDRRRGHWASLLVARRHSRSCKLLNDQTLEPGRVGLGSDGFLRDLESAVARHAPAAAVELKLFGTSPGIQGGARQFHDASVVIATWGSSLANLIFARPGVHVIVVLPAHTRENFPWLRPNVDSPLVTSDLWYYGQAPHSHLTTVALVGGTASLLFVDSDHDSAGSGSGHDVHGFDSDSKKYACEKAIPLDALAAHVAQVLQRGRVPLNSGGRGGVRGAAAVASAEQMPSAANAGCGAQPQGDMWTANERERMQRELADLKLQLRLCKAQNTELLRVFDDLPSAAVTGCVTQPQGDVGASEAAD